MAPTTDRPMSAVISDIVENVQRLIRGEIQLAKVEIREEVAKFRRGAILIAAASLVLVLALGVLLLSAVYALALVWPLWASALAVGLVAALVGALFAMTGMRTLRAVMLPPPRTVSSIKENIQWAKTQVG